MKFAIQGTIPFLLLGLALGCDQSFNPKGTYDEQLVVYSVLTAEIDTQYVRVYLTYDPPQYDPNSINVDNAITDAIVSVSGAPQFRDTTIRRADRSRYPTDVHVYVARPFKVQPGSAYILDVATTSKGRATAKTTVPGKGSIQISTPYVLERPDRYAQDVNLFLTLSPITQGYLIRLLFQYEITVGGNTLVQYQEVPQTVQTIDGVTYPSFPQLARRLSLNREFVSFTNTAYRYAANQVRVNTQNQNLMFKAVLFVMTQVEPSFYKYYNIVSGFQDPNSIRTDQPDYTNIQGGIGVFGAMTLDSTLYTLPSDF